MTDSRELEWADELCYLDIFILCDNGFKS